MRFSASQPVHTRPHPVQVNKATWPQGATPLYAACLHGHVATVQALLLASPPAVDLEARLAESGATALGAAAASGHYACAQALLAAGAAVDAGRANGATALHMAAETGQVCGCARAGGQKCVSPCS